MKHIHGGNYKYYNINKNEFLDFSVNINILGPPINIKLNKNDLINYPDIDSQSVINFYKKNYNSENKIIPTNGAIEAIYLLSLFLNIKKISIVIPSFFDYENAFKIHNIKTNFIRLNENFNITFNEIKKHLNNSDAIIFGNPNNPTGNYILDKKTILKLADEYKSKIFIIDEAFSEFSDLFNKYSLLNIKLPKNIVIIHSMTKFYAIAGLRIGCLILNKTLANKALKYKIPWNINIASEIFIKKLINFKKLNEFKEKSKHFFKKERKFLYTQINKIEGFKAYQTFTNFLLIKLKDSKKFNDFFQFLLKNKIFVRDCSNFRGLNKGFFRICIKNRAVNKKLIRVLKQWKDS